MKKSYDHTPHEIFVELEELQQSSHGSLEWKEIARWIKYEENFEDISNRWGKPHISYLNFNALFALRKGLERGSILLDLEERDMPNIAARIVDHMVLNHQLPSNQRDSVYKVLLLNSKHIKETSHALRRASRMALGLNDDESHSTTGESHQTRRRSSVRKSLANIWKSNTVATSMDYDGTQRRNTLLNLEMEADPEERDRNVMNLDLKKKLADDSEAFACLVGALDFLSQPSIAFVRLAEGVILENMIEVPIPVRFIFVLLGPYGTGVDYREIGRSISTLMANKSFHEVAYKAHSRGQILAAINDFLNTSIVFPPSEWRNNDLVPVDEIRNRTRENLKKSEEMKGKKGEMDEEKEITLKEEVKKAEVTQIQRRDPLKREGKLFYGVIQDIKLRYPQYLSDIKDGLNPQVLSASIFIFFAALSPAITFGGIYADKTDKLLGVGETLLLTSINGIIFALFSGQPLIIIGATGPLMIFDFSLLSFCKSMDIDFLSIRVWLGIWIAVVGILVGAFEAEAIVKKFTKFTEEMYASLVCLIFIIGGFENLVAIFFVHPLSSAPCLNETDFFDISNETMINATFVNETDTEVKNIELLVKQPNTALFSLVLMFGTYMLAINLKSLRNLKYFGREVRRSLGDFGVPIAIVVMVLISYFTKDVYTDNLTMPKGLKPSNAEVRGWIISPFGMLKPLPIWCMFAAAPASLLLFILVFLEGNICQLILTNPERCLKKGSAFHLDIMLSCIINTASGFLGAPFMSPACVRTIAHMAALTVVNTNVPPGESPKIIGCIEQRLSALVVATFVGLAVMLYAILNLIPNAVLLGIFLYMGISATDGIQFFDRIYLFIIPAKHHPNVSYVKSVRTFKMHLFTAIQVLIMIILWIVKMSPASLAVPFILLCLIPIRLYLLPLIFSPQELFALDGGKKPEDKGNDDEPDFYEAAHDLPTQIEYTESHHTKM